MRKAKIVATIGPASDNPAQLRSLIAAGLDVARINMSHGEQSHHREVISRIRRIVRETGKAVAVLLDLSGPKIRIGKLTGGKAWLVTGSELRIVAGEIEGSGECFSVNYPGLPAEVRPGNRLLIGDGEIELRVLAHSSQDILARVEHGGLLGQHKGVSLPGAGLSIPSVTEKDVSDLRFGISCGVDLVAQSFVRNADDCRRARALIHEFGGEALLIAKIEKPEAVDDLDNILAVADGVMVARGDLAVETSPEVVPLLQKRMISAAVAAQKPVITATQMLQSMIENPRPTRAEASDVANAILDGSDALMLSAESAVGQFPVESVAMMDRIIRCTEESAAANQGQAALWLQRQTGSCDRAMAEAARFAAEEIGAGLVVVFTQSGDTARSIAALRPRQRIIAFTTLVPSYHQLALSWGVEPYLLDRFPSGGEEMLALADQALLRHRLAAPGETIIAVTGSLEGSDLSNSMKIHRLA